MSPAERTLADAWNEAGYDTTYAGKWHLYGGGHGVLPDYDNITTNRIPVPRAHRGRWQKWLGFELCNSHFDTCYFEDDDTTPRRLPGFQTDGLFDLAMKELSAKRDASRPFAFLLSVEPPHPPYEVPKEFMGRWAERELIEDPNFMVHNSSLDRFTGNGNLFTEDQREAALDAERVYYAMVENLDANVGRMMRFLDNSRLSENTIVVFLADHGHCGFRHCWQQKEMPFEESIGIPLIISDPSNRDSHGSTADAVLCTEDLFPTLLGLTGCDFGDVPGEDFSGLVNASSPIPERDSILLENTFIVRPDLPRFDKGWRGLRSKRYKYTLEGGIDGGARPWQLYDLLEDPYELNNLLDHSDSESLATRMHRCLCKKLIESDDDFPVAEAFGIPAQSLPFKLNPNR